LKETVEDEEKEFGKNQAQKQVPSTKEAKYFIEKFY
jgi:hypothetical protein